MYVIVVNNSVVLGPMAWKKTFFQNFLHEEYEISVSLPPQYTEPIITTEFKILPSRLIYITIDEKIFQHHGPFWEITDTEATGTFEPVRKSIDSVKNNLKQWITDRRWKTENSGFKYQLGSYGVTIPTTRETRGQFATAVADTMWKFAEGWYILTADDLTSISNKISQHVQTCFAEEYELHNEVDSIDSLEELKIVQERLKVDVVC